MEASEDLESTLWQQLPFELLENILTKLPVSNLMSMCQVCKRWKTLIQSPKFARRCDSIQPLVFFHYAGYQDPFGYNAPYLAVPNTRTNTWEKHTLNFASGPITVAAADQGLICFKPNYSTDTLFIYNPLTRQWKELRIPVEDDDPLPWQRKELRLPPEDLLLYSRTEVERKLLGLIVDRETGNYKVVVGWIKLEIDTDLFPEDSNLISRCISGKPRRTLIYDSDSSTWTSTSVYPDLLLDEVGPRWKPWEPGASVRCGQNLYWLVEEADGLFGTLFRFIVRFDVKAGIWTVDEPDLPYQRLVDVAVDPAFDHSDFPYTLLESGGREPDGQLESKPPQWNFHLAPHDGVVYVMAFDSLIRREAFSGEFSSLMPEVKMVDADFVCKVRELADPYLPTKVASQGEVWYVVFEHGGVRWHERGTKPLLVFAYSPRRNIWGWLPKLDSNSSCSDVLPKGAAPYVLPDLFTLTQSLTALV